MQVSERLVVAFAYFIHHGLELLLIPFKVLRLLDFVCRYRQRLRKLCELSEAHRRSIELKTQFVHLVILRALDSLQVEDIKMLCKTFADFHFAAWRIL